MTPEQLQQAQQTRFRQLIELQVGNLVTALAEANAQLEIAKAQIAILTEERDKLKAAQPPAD